MLSYAVYVKFHGPMGYYWQRHGVQNARTPHEAVDRALRSLTHKMNDQRGEYVGT